MFLTSDLIVKLRIDQSVYLNPDPLPKAAQQDYFLETILISIPETTQISDFLLET